VPDETAVEHLVSAPTAAPAAGEAGAAAIAPPASTIAGRLVGLGLHVAAVPFVVPLYLTAAVSRRLGITGDR
jgi:hypothetical protein